ncbi:MAG: tetratricopeptide repeat protein [Pyrinomonadaceae bacterium]
MTEKAWGSEHPFIAVLLSYLAYLYDDKGEYARAESIHRRVLTINMKAVGPEHPVVARTLSKLALTFALLP